MFVVVGGEVPLAIKLNIPREQILSILPPSFEPVEMNISLKVGKKKKKKKKKKCAIPFIFSVYGPSKCTVSQRDTKCY